MKKHHLVAAAAALAFMQSAIATADSWAIPNKNGGEIVVTDRKCSDHKNLLQAYNYGNGGKYMEGCWALIDDMVHVAWSDGSRYTYPLDAFYKKSTSPKKQGASL